MNIVNLKVIAKLPPPKKKTKNKPRASSKSCSQLFSVRLQQHSQHATAAQGGRRKREKEREFTQSPTLIQWRISVKMLSNRKQFCLLLHNSELCFLPIRRFLLHLFFLLLPLNSCFFSPIYGISSPFVLADPSIEHSCVFFQFTDFSSIFFC